MWNWKPFQVAHSFAMKPITRWKLSLKMHARTFVVTRPDLTWICSYCCVTRIVTKRDGNSKDCYQSLNINTGNFSFKPVSFYQYTWNSQYFLFKNVLVALLYNLFLCVDGRGLLENSDLFAILFSWAVTSPPRIRWTLKMAANSCGPWWGNF